MGNTFVTPTIVAKEALMQLENNCVMGNLVHRGYEEEFKSLSNGWKKGNSITIKAPVYARVTDGPVIDVVDLREEDITFTLSYHKTVAHRLTAAEMTYSIDKFSERVIQPAMVAHAQFIDETILGLYKYFANQVGTPGVTPANYLTYALAGARLTDMAVPMDNRYCVIDPTAKAYLTDQLKGVNNPGMAQTMIQRAFSGPIAGFDLYESANIQNHTCGTAAGLTTPLVNDTVAEGDTTINIDTNGSWTLTLTAGDIFTIADVYAVNPVGGKKLGYLRQFVCETHTDNGNDATINCTPGTAPWNIYSAAATKTYLPYQTVYALPANNAAVAVAGSASLVHPVNMAFHKNAMSLAMVPFEVPPSCSWSSQMSKNGYSITVTRDFDIINYAEYIRFDVLFGVKVLNPFMGVRIAG